MAEAEVVRCPQCGAKNRLASAPAGRVPACGRCGASLPWLQVVCDADFDDQVRAGVPVLVDFWAAWCGPCHMVDAVLRELAADRAGALKIVKVNVDENRATAQRFGVRSLPTLGLFRDGEQVDTLVGALPKRQLVTWLDRHRPS